MSYFRDQRPLLDGASKTIKFSESTLSSFCHISRCARVLMVTTHAHARVVEVHFGNREGFYSHARAYSLRPSTRVVLQALFLDIFSKILSSILENCGHFWANLAKISKILSQFRKTEVKIEKMSLKF